MWWHEAIIDEMLAHPEWTKRDIAAKIGCTPAMVYLITGSDHFKVRFAQRRQAFTERHDTIIGDKLASVAEKTLDIIAEQLEKKRDAVPLVQLIDLQDKVLSRLGYGQKTPPTAPAVQVNVGAAPHYVPVSLEDLASAQAALRRSEEAKLVGGSVWEVAEGNSTPSRMLAGEARSTAREVCEANGRPSADIYTLKVEQPTRVRDAGGLPAGGIVDRRQGVICADDSEL